ncbi:uncharacterized protein Z520_02520 [Fonsecaea multimorphosa CBS 102226]|uniref:Uncharacterized protein n=1 Tax=Fonsecaea multimorphosa CBS 102226 TaxID=1442371 RepID=A0A0D2IZB2_9EURO|nr:uncharacterized protein Z520_02520 [Fonsecaea multimorphosa CBS 102226]KIY02382.1 hypothetical protein Z520_02520 [Fonsecaea multimorphosa CBS 102226]OAL29024.1 hypothetical protein AYO22_02460 [Fonsecaea multimorphosa]
MTPGSTFLGLLGRRSDLEDLQQDSVLGQLAEAKASLVQDVARILRSFMGLEPSSYPLVDIAGYDVHEQAPERQPCHTQTLLTPSLLSGFLSNQVPDHLERWFAQSDSAYLFTLDDDRTLWRWKEKSESMFPLDGKEDTGSLDTSGVEKEVWSDDNRSQQTGITSAVSAI